jgi:phosphatidylglycerol:prolipoprotein diacylglycerol transferase
MYPRLFHLYGPLWIYGYGAMIALGFLVFLLCTINHPVRQKCLTMEQYFNVLFAGFLAAITGGRFLFVITHLQDFEGRFFEIFYPWIGGLTLIGGVVGVLVVVPAYLFIHRIPVLPLLDVCAIYAPLMQAIARIGCLLSGCCYGAIAGKNALLSVVFTDPEGFCPYLHVPLLPTQLYMSLASLLIFVSIFYFYRWARSTPGASILLFLVLESAARFFIDFWRGDREDLQTFLTFFGQPITLSQPQLFSLVLLVLSIIGFVWTIRKNR